jgi:hypothetical protein
MGETKVRVISDTVTFYPVEPEGQESHQQNDNLSLRTTLVYLREQMGEDFQFFTAEDLFVVLQQWRGMLFFIQSNDAMRQAVMRLQLQTIREILIFLFGVKFESVMRRCILSTNRVVFAQYVDTYLSICDSDYLTLACTTRPDPESKAIGDMFRNLASGWVPGCPGVLTCILFRNHKLVSRYAPSDNSVTLDLETFLILSIFEKVEYGGISGEPCTLAFDPTFIGRPDNPTKKQKTAFLRISGTPIACNLSSTRCSANSPFVILVVSESTSGIAKPEAGKSETQAQIADFLVTTAARMMNLPIDPVRVPLIDRIDDLLHYIVIDRTRGDVWECPLDHTIQYFQEAFGDLGEDEIKAEAKKVTSQLVAYGMSAMMRGNTTMMWGKLDYQFCYELRFEDEAGQVIEPTHVFTPPGFNDDTGINYGLICDTLFQGHSRITCLELMSIYRGKVQVKAAMAGNQRLFRLFKARK